MKTLQKSDNESGASESSKMPRSKRLITIEPVVALYFMVLNPANPLVQQFLYSEIAEQKNYTVTGDDDGSYCISFNLTDEEERVQEQIQEETADFVMYLEIAETIPSLVTALIMGPLSDVVGRKPALVLPLIGNIVRCLSIMSIQLFGTPLYMCIIGTGLDGMLGGPATFIPAAYAYTADTSSTEKRSLRMTILQTCFFVSGAISQIYMGYFIEHAGFLYPYVMLAAMNFINILYVLIIMPESVERRWDIPLFSCEQLKATARTWIFPTYKHNRWRMYFCLLNFVFIGVIINNRNIFINLYSLNSPLCWGAIYIGFFSAYIAIVYHFSSIIMTFLLVRRIGEAYLAMLGALTGAGSMVFLSFSTTTWMMALVPFVGIGSEAVSSMTRSILSGLVPPEEQGCVFSGQSIVERFSSVVGSIVLTNIYGATLDFFKGFVFIVIAIVYFSIFLSMSFYTLRDKRERKTISPTIDSIIVGKEWENGKTGKENLSYSTKEKIVESCEDINLNDKSPVKA